ncbi:MAG: hypothetical protein NXI00_12150 [Cytophagales bacterium]|nr:hypothetical protein [Cytophagales bacterium]
MKSTIILVLLLIGQSAFSQAFMPGFDMFSHKKPAHLTLADGTKIEGEIARLQRKRNNISGIDMEINGEKITYAPEEVKEMYLPAHGLNKFSLKSENTFNTSKTYDLDMINEGYGFFENTEVAFGGKVQTLMMQLVNPDFANKVKIYFDPMAMETMKVGIGPMSTGGIDRSYYIKVGDEPAYKLSKANFKDELPKIFASCPEMQKKVSKKPNWKELPKYFYGFDICE